MTEVLTESFCERCGTRYTFETVQQRGRPLRRLTTFGRGLQHFIVQGDSSFDEAMAVARSEAEQRTTTAQLEAFHRTFNFCLSCRQYTCRECWNAVEGRCLSCAPLPVEETLAPAAILATSTPVAVAAPPIDGTHVAREPEVVDAEPVAEVVEPQPMAEVEPEPVAEVVEPELVVEVVEPEPVGEVVEPEPVAEVVEPEPVVEVVEPESLAPGPAPEAEALPAVEPVPEPEPAASGAAPFPGFQPGRSLDDEIAAYELRMAALAQIPLDPGPALPPEPQVIERVVASATPVAGPETVSPKPPIAAPAVGVAAPTPDEPTPLGTPGTCRSCGLSISASARFCRRCGTRQAA